MDRRVADYKFNLHYAHAAFNNYKHAGVILTIYLHVVELSLLLATLYPDP